MCHFSLQYQNSVKQTGDEENGEKYRVENIVSSRFFFIIIIFLLDSCKLINIYD